jgi:hypothetical protein
MFVCILFEIKDEEETYEYYGPFSSEEEAYNFGETTTDARDPDGDRDLGCMVEPLLPPAK